MIRDQCRTRLFPVFFSLIMIDDPNARGAAMWKYVDNATISEVLGKGQESREYSFSGRRSHKASKGCQTSVK